MKNRQQNTFKKIALVALGLLLVVCCVAGSLAIYANSSIYDVDAVDSDFFKSWMSCLDDDALVTDVVIPGSHNSASHEMSWLGSCQSLSIKQEMQVGVRYFNIRVTKKSGVLKTFHGPITGVEVAPIIDDINSFLTANPSEFLILDFQKFDNDVQSELLDLVFGKIASDKIVVNNSGLDDMSFVSTLKYGDVKGKAIIVWASDEHIGDTRLFARNDDGSNIANTALSSPYEGKLSKKSSKSFVGSSLPKYLDIIENSENIGGKGFNILQGQLTDGMAIFGPRLKERTHNQRMSDFIATLPDNASFEHVNIIMRDFNDVVKAKQIIGLNTYKNLFDAEKLAISGMQF